jgi:membrane-associated phospholipid phosphatase
MSRQIRLRRTAVALALVVVTAMPCWAQATTGGVGRNLLADLRWSANTLEADAEDVVRSPCHVGDLFAEDGLFHQRAFYYTLLGAGAALGGAFGLDKMMRANLHDMPQGVADGLQTSGGWFVAASGIVLYGYGLFQNDDRARQEALTGGEGAMLAGLITTGLKAATGRLRPRDGEGAFQFFDGGTSFPSGHATPAFAGAAAVSAYFDDRWYALVPEYTAAFAVGFGRIGNDAHWFSDIIGAGLVGVGTTELLRYMHRQHAADPSRFRVFPVVGPGTAGLELALDW